LDPISLSPEHQEDKEAQITDALNNLPFFNLKPLQEQRNRETDYLGSEPNKNRAAFVRRKNEGEVAVLDKRQRRGEKLAQRQ
jgi:hypothetical protein